MERVQVRKAVAVGVGRRLFDMFKDDRGRLCIEIKYPNEQPFIIELDGYLKQLEK